MTVLIKGRSSMTDERTLPEGITLSSGHYRAKVIIFVFKNKSEVKTLKLLLLP